MKERAIIKLIEASITPAERVFLGDDAAYLFKENLLVSTDSLIEDVHFRANQDPRQIGHLAAAVNLSDLAAMGASSAYLTLAVSLPVQYASENWVGDFLAGFLACRERHGGQLIGGDLTGGSVIAINVCVMGKPFFAGRIAKRSFARPGYRIFVSGSPGAAAAGFWSREAGLGALYPALSEAFLWPQPRFALAESIMRGSEFAPVCLIDLSDSLLVSLQCICAQSGVGVSVDLARLPRSAEFLACAVRAQLDPLQWLLAGDGDYELLLAQAPELEAPEGMTEIGLVLDRGEGLSICDGARRLNPSDYGGYEHFGG